MTAMPLDRGGASLHALLGELTPAAAKIDAYAGDTYVQESVEQLERLGIDPVGFARQHSLLLLKPDAIVARAVEPTLQWLPANGFRVVAAHRMRVNRHLVRALWYFAWNIASPERRRLADLLIDISEVLVLVVHGADGALPVPVRLTEAKGATDPRKRNPGELRYLLGRHNFLLNLVHSPDDPADVLRELAVYFDENTRADLLGQATAGLDRTAAVSALAADLYAQVPARSFDRDDALRGVLDDLRRAGIAAGAAEDADGARLLYSAWAAGAQLDPWSVLVLGSYVLPMRVGLQPQTLPPVAAREWLEGRS
ncbi:nucleoside-diphosphate kinase [Nocardia lijiangensis]|uniref:nucleoside-diphosphate kinase n=1 Tax=Nocardia lijiangensis TaxID=299618 RepID=UPI000B00C7E9|nr:nucleoside-diphosphate kinase [Nocardia lijiangensis]